MRSCLCNCFYIHSSFCRIHDHVFASCPIEQHRHIVFTRLRSSRIIHIFSDQYLVYFFSFWGCLRSNQLHSDNISSNSFQFFKIFREFDPTSFSAPTSVNLRLDHMPIGSCSFCKLFGRSNSLSSCFCYDTSLNGYSKTREHFLSLIFV